MNGTKEIRFYGFKPSRPQIREIERRMEKWLRSELGTAANAYSYLVEVELLEDHHAYQCDIHIELPLGNWNVQGIGKSLHDAITFALKKLPEKRKPIIGSGFFAVSYAGP